MLGLALCLEVAVTEVTRMRRHRYTSINARERNDSDSAEKHGKQ